MKQRKLLLFCLALFIFGLTSHSFAQRGKSELAVGYGYWSDYSLVNKAPYSASTGVIALNYRYFLSKDISLGMGLAYENISTWASFVTIAPEVTVKYLDTRDDRIRVRLYGSASYGISILGDNVIGLGSADESGAKPYAFQLTPIGARFGRQFAYFVELGFGYKGLISGGAAFRFPRILPVHKTHKTDDDSEETTIENKKDDKE